MAAVNEPLIVPAPTKQSALPFQTASIRRSPDGKLTLRVQPSASSSSSSSSSAAAAAPNHSASNLPADVGQASADSDPDSDNNVDNARPGVSAVSSPPAAASPAAPPAARRPAPEDNQLGEDVLPAVIKQHLDAYKSAEGTFTEVPLLVTLVKAVINDNNDWRPPMKLPFAWARDKMEDRDSYMKPFAGNISLPSKKTKFSPQDIDKFVRLVFELRKSGNGSDSMSMATSTVTAAGGNAPRRAQRYRLVGAYARLFSDVRAVFPENEGGNKRALELDE